MPDSFEKLFKELQEVVDRADSPSAKKKIEEAEAKDKSIAQQNTVVEPDTSETVETSMSTATDTGILEESHGEKTDWLRRHEMEMEAEDEKRGPVHGPDNVV